jgi:hypothetical protein
VHEPEEPAGAEAEEAEELQVFLPLAELEALERSSSTGRSKRLCMEIF